MAGYGKETREKKLREAYRFGRILLKGSKGKPFKGFAGAIQKGVYNPDYLLTADWEKIAELSEDAFVEYAEAAKAYKDEYSRTIQPVGDQVQPGLENKPTPTQASIDFTSADMEKLLGHLAAGVYGIRDKDGNDIPLPDEVSLGVLEMVANCVRMWGRIPNYKAFKIQRDAILAK